MEPSTNLFRVVNKLEELRLAAPLKNANLRLYVMEAKSSILVYTDEELLSNCLPVEIPSPDIPTHLGDDLGSRLLISQVVCENFKSYGGRRVLGPFHKNFTCIIGPNGSGKSNVIDALLFVFGFRASKVRSKKLGSLIHVSDNLPNVACCQVAVFFQRILDTGTGAKDYEVVPGSEFVVSRKAFRDNSNSYYINDNRANFREVTNLLRRHGIDLDHNRFLILQGEVEQISLMKAKATTEYESGFLEYLEDIIGSSRFKKPLAILADRIERLKDIRLEKLARVKAMEKEKNDLEVVRDEALAYLRLVNKVTRVKNVIYQQNRRKELKKENGLREKIGCASVELETFVKKVKELSSELSTLKKCRERQNARATELQERHRDAKDRFSKFEAEDTRIRDEHAHLKTQGKKTLKTLQSERKRLEEVKNLPGEAEGRRLVLQNQLDELEQNKIKQETIYKETMDILAAETEPLRKKVEEAEAALAPVQKAADKAASQHAIAQQQLDLAMSAFRREKDRMTQAQDGMQATKSRLAERERQLVEATQKLEGRAAGSRDGRRSDSRSHRTSRISIDNMPTGLREVLESSEMELVSFRETEAALVVEVNRMRSTLSDAKSSFQTDNSRNRVLNSLLTATQEGKLSGILGRLGDLGAIPQKYDIAISTCCGALDHIVVETMEHAQKAVEFLKQNNLGQASFIGLDKMARWLTEAAKPFEAPVPSAKRIYDLIEVPNPAVRPCFYFGVRNTLVAENLDIATEWAFKHKQRNRVVTLRGQLIEVSGAMSGGGGRPLSGRMLTDLNKTKGRKSVSNVVTEKSLADMERNVLEKENQLVQVRQQRERLEENAVQMRRQVIETERNIHKWQVEIVRLREEAETLFREAEQAEKRAANTGPSPTERKKLETSISTLEKERNTKSEKAAKLRANVEGLKAQLVEVGAARLAAVRSRVALVERKIKETSDQFTKLEVEIRSAHRNEAKITSKVEAYEKEVESLKERLLQVERQLLEIESTAKTCMTEFQEIQKLIATLNEERERVNVEIEKAEGSLASAKKEEGILQRQAEELRSQAKDSADRARAWQAKLRELQLHAIDGEDDDEGEDEPAFIVGVSIQQCVNTSQDSVSALSSFPAKERNTKLPTYTDEQLEEMNVSEPELKKMEDEITTMAPNMSAIEQYRQKVNLYLSRVAEFDRITELRAEQLKQEAEAKSRRLTEFMAGFNVITTRLKEMYQMLTQGGDAELELIDSLDPFSEGIVFSVRPPKKTWKNIANLSGGEKTLSSLALVFALHHYKPTPLYVMDEIDAALDFKNVSIVGNYVMERTKDAQFIIISLRNNMFELADRLVGIYKTHNITKSVPIDCAELSLRLAEAVAHIRGVIGGIANGPRVVLDRTTAGEQRAVKPQQQNLDRIRPSPNPMNSLVSISPNTEPVAFANVPGEIVPSRASTEDESRGNQASVSSMGTPTSFPTFPPTDCD